MAGVHAQHVHGRHRSLLKKGSRSDGLVCMKMRVGHETEGTTGRALSGFAGDDGDCGFWGSDAALRGEEVFVGVDVAVAAGFFVGDVLGVVVGVVVALLAMAGATGSAVASATAQCNGSHDRPSCCNGKEHAQKCEERGREGSRRA
jgi:hypothetical protein